MSVFIHPLAHVQRKEIGLETRIWQFVVVLPKARIGAACNICAHVLIENDVIIGDRVTVKSGVQLWDGLRRPSRDGGRRCSGDEVGAGWRDRGRESGAHRALSWGRR